MFKTFLIATTSMAFSATALAGGATSSGGRVLQWVDNPWFIGRSSFSYCIQVDENFSRDFDRVAADTNYALKAWENYFAPQKLPSTLPLPDGQSKKITFRATSLGRCAEHSEADLKFYYGVINDAVKETLQSNPGGFASFALRESFEHNTGWSKGFIWVAPDSGAFAYKNSKTAFWNNDTVSLQNILMHEVGHVMGLQHRMGGVMDESLPESIADEALNYETGRGGTFTQFPLTLASFWRAPLLNQDATVCQDPLLPSDSLSKIFPESTFGDRLCVRTERVPNMDDKRYFVFLKKGDGRTTAPFELVDRNPIYMDITMAEGVVGSYYSNTERHYVRSGLLWFVNQKVNGSFVQGNKKYPGGISFDPRRVTIDMIVENKVVTLGFEWTYWQRHAELTFP